MSDWISSVFDANQSEIGQRLGVPFIRAQADSVDILIDRSILSLSSSLLSDNAICNDVIRVNIYQSSVGVIGISTVVWDAGLYLIDFLIHEQSVIKDYRLGRVLDIGCGTGICGIISAYLNSDYILLTDAHISDIIIQNIELIPQSLQNKIKTLQYNWENEIPTVLSKANDNDDRWDTILCSDVLYDSKYHGVLLQLISNLKFNRLILSYKRRHDEEEKRFLISLNDKYSIELVDPDSIELKNLNKSSLSGLHLFIITLLGPSRSDNYV